MVVSFDTTEAVMEMEERAGILGIPGRIIPIPPEIDAGCGMAWAVPVDDAEDLAFKLKDGGIRFASIDLAELFVRQDKAESHL